MSSSRVQAREAWDGGVASVFLATTGPSPGRQGSAGLFPSCTLQTTVLCPSSCSSSARPREHGGPELAPWLHTPKPCKRHRIFLIFNPHHFENSSAPIQQTPALDEALSIWVNQGGLLEEEERATPGACPAFLPQAPPPAARDSAPAPSPMLRSGHLDAFLTGRPLGQP